MTKRIKWILIVFVLSLTLFNVVVLRIIESEYGKTMTIYVAKEDLFPNTKISSDSLEAMEISYRDYDESIHIRNKEDVVGLYVRVDTTVWKDQPICLKDITSEDSSSSVKLLQDKTLLTVKVNEISLSNLRSRDFVDFYFESTLNGESTKLIHGLLLEDVLVVSLYDSSLVEVDLNTNDHTVSFITVALSSDELNIMKLAMMMGEVYPLVANQDEFKYYSDLRLKDYIISRSINFRASNQSNEVD